MRHRVGDDAAAESVDGPKSTASPVDEALRCKANHQLIVFIYIFSVFGSKKKKKKGRERGEAEGEGNVSVFVRQLVIGVGSSWHKDLLLLLLDLFFLFFCFLGFTTAKATTSPFCSPPRVQRYCVLIGVAAIDGCVCERERHICARDGT